MSFASFVSEHPFADPHLAARHFAARLSVETDPSDVHADLMDGKPDFVLLDSRSAAAYEKGHLPNAISLPHREIDEVRLSGYSKETLFVVYCYGPACNAAHKAALRLSTLGYRVKEMIGGFEYWVREGFPIEGTEIADPDLVGRYVNP